MPWMLRAASCPLCRHVDGCMPGAGGAGSSSSDDPPSDGAGKEGQDGRVASAASAVFLHPSSSVQRGASPQAAGRWVAYQTLTRTSRAFVRNVALVDPTWPEVTQAVDVATVERQARNHVRVIRLPESQRSLIGLFVGRRGSALQAFEAQMNATILAQDGIVEVYATPESVDAAAWAVEERFRLLEEEKEERRRAWEIEQARRQAERERRHQDTRCRNALRFHEIASSALNLHCPVCVLGRSTLSGRLSASGGTRTAQLPKLLPYFWHLSSRCSTSEVPKTRLPEVG